MCAFKISCTPLFVFGKDNSIATVTVTATTISVQNLPERSKIKIITMSELQKNMSLLMFRDERRLDGEWMYKNYEEWWIGIRCVYPSPTGIHLKYNICCATNTDIWEWIISQDNKKQKELVKNVTIFYSLFLLFCTFSLLLLHILFLFWLMMVALLLLAVGCYCCCWCRVEVLAFGSAIKHSENYSNFITFEFF